MLRTLVTGAVGNVGRSTVAECLAEGDRIAVFEAMNERRKFISIGIPIILACALPGLSK